MNLSQLEKRLDENIQRLYDLKLRGNYISFVDFSRSHGAVGIIYRQDLDDIPKISNVVNQCYQQLEKLRDEMIDGSKWDNLMTFVDKTNQGIKRSANAAMNWRGEEVGILWAQLYRHVPISLIKERETMMKNLLGFEMYALAYLFLIQKADEFKELMSENHIKMVPFRRADQANYSSREFPVISLSDLVSSRKNLFPALRKHFSVGDEYLKFD